MPIWLRKFTYNKLLEYYKKQSQEKDMITADTDINKLTPLPKQHEIHKPSIHYKSPKK